MERNSQIILAARSIPVHLPTLLGGEADRVRGELDALLGEWDRQPDQSVIDRIMVLLTGNEVTREWLADFLDADDGASASTRGDGGAAGAWSAAPSPAPAPAAPTGISPPGPADFPSADPPAVRHSPSLGGSRKAGAPRSRKFRLLQVFDRRRHRATAVLGSGAAGHPSVPADSGVGGPAGDAGPGPGSLPPAVPEPAAPSSVYGLLNCPETVAVGREFELTVGLSDRPAYGVSGPAMEVPPPHRTSYTLTVKLLAFGFRLREGENLQLTMQVSADEWYPSATLHLTPQAEPGDGASSRIKAMYSVDGQPLGFAVRYIKVTPSASVATAAPSAGGVNLSIPSAPAPADLTVVVTKKDRSDTELAWQFESPHGLDLPDDSTVTDIGKAPQNFARDLTNQMSVSEGQSGMFQVVQGKGRRIRGVMPTEFWRLLEQAAQCAAGPPTLLFITDQPYIPWELAALPPGVLDQDPEAPPFLCARAQVGRWLQPDADADYAAAEGLGPIQPPPTQIRVDAIAVVSGVYTKLPRLREAEAECEELATRYGASKIDANRDAVGACIDGIPDADILHFAVHGKWDQSGAQDGLVLVDGTLYPDQVEGGKLLARPLVFLNACQVGQGSEVLGDYAGMAAAFLRIGASAVVAPLWSIDDATARSIAVSFYQAALVEGVKPAEIIRRARAGFKPTRDKQSSTYMAYQFFGDPRLELVRTAASAPPAE